MSNSFWGDGPPPRLIPRRLSRYDVYGRNSDYADELDETTGEFVQGESVLIAGGLKRLAAFAKARESLAQYKYTFVVGSDDRRQVHSLSRENH